MAKLKLRIAKTVNYLRTGVRELFQQGISLGTQARYSVSMPKKLIKRNTFAWNPNHFWLCSNNEEEMNMDFKGKLNVNGVELPVTGAIDRENKWGFLESKIDVMLQPTLHSLKIDNSECIVITPYQSGNRCRHEFRLREVDS